MFLKEVICLLMLVYSINTFKFLGDHSLEPTMYGFNIRVDLPGKCLYNTELGDKIHALGSDVDINLLLQKGQLKKGYVFQDYVKYCSDRPNVDKVLNERLNFIAQHCVEEKLRKDFKTNSILATKTMTDLFCSMEEVFYKKFITEDNSDYCFKDNEAIVTHCEQNSFDVRTDGTATQKEFVLPEFLSGRVCNFNFDKMLECTNNALKATPCEYLQKQLKIAVGIVKKYSLCYKNV